MTARRIYGLLMTLLTLALAALLCLSAAGFYRAGLAARAAGEANAPFFTREGVAERLKGLWPLAALWLAGALASWLIPALRPARPRPAPASAAPVPAAPDQRRMALLRLALLAAAAALIVLGALNGGALDMLQKAVKICTECVGLG